MKKHKLTSIEGVDISLFNCVYSPAKRRGPVPGRVLLARNKAHGKQSDQESNKIHSGSRPSSIPSSQTQNHGVVGLSGLPTTATPTSSLSPTSTSGTSGAHLFSTKDALIAQQRQLMLQAQGLNGYNLSGIGDTSVMGLFGASGTVGRTLGNGALGSNSLFRPGNTAGTDITGNQPQSIFQAQQQQFQLNQGLQSNEANQAQSGRSQRMKLDPKHDEKDEIEHNLSDYTVLLELNNQEGNMLRSYYMMSMNEVFNLPPIPTNEEYCRSLSIPISSLQIPHTSLAALNAARFAEVALGAQANSQVSLALELSNSTVLCLRECVKNAIHTSCILNVGRAFFLHGVFRSLRGDFERYLKYRRICMSHLQELTQNSGVNHLLAAIAFHDAWVYMMHNANEENLPDISKFRAPVTSSSSSSSMMGNSSSDVWMKGRPPVFLDNDAPPLCRSLDALASAVRTCCEQANEQFQAMENIPEGFDMAKDGQDNEQYSVMATKDEFCARNMVLSAHKLLQTHEIELKSTKRPHGQRLIISAMDAFLEDGENSCEGFTDAQVQSILLVCNTAIERPLLLHGGGPIYHIISNAAVLLCHLLNGMYTRMNDESNPFTNDMETTLFEEILDTFTSVRKLLNIHRRKLPLRIRCHSIPRAKVGVKNEDLIDLNETIMCSCRGCIGFVLMKCSPCVALERAQRSKIEEEYRKAHEKFPDLESETGRALKLGEDAEFDEALLSVLQELISTQ